MGLGIVEAGLPWICRTGLFIRHQGRSQSATRLAAHYSMRNDDCQHPLGYMLGYLWDRHQGDTHDVKTPGGERFSAKIGKIPSWCLRGAGPCE